MFGDDYEWLKADMPLSARRKYKGVFEVCLDGSGNFDQDRAVVYAGALSTQTQWRAFGESWNQLLEKHDLAYLKAAEAATFYNEFQPKYAEWGDERVAKRDAALMEFALLQRQYRLRVNGCGYVLGADGSNPFDSAMKVAERKKQLFRCAITSLLRAIPPDYAVIVLCDVEKDADEKIRGWVDSLGKAASDKVARVVGVGFFDDKYMPQLQYADMVSWLVRHELIRQVYERSKPVNPLLQVVMEGSSGRLELVEPGGFNKGAEYDF